MESLFEKVLPAIPRFFSDLLALIVSPKTFLEEVGGLSDRTGAYTFAGVALLLSHIATIPFYVSWQADPISKVLVGLTVSGLMLGCTALALKLSWTVVGGRGSLSHLITYLGYGIGVTALLPMPFALFGMAVLREMDPSYFKALSEFKELPDDFSVPGVVTFLVFFGIGWLCVEVWWGAAWGAFRKINNVSKTRGVVAFILFQVALWILVIGGSLAAK